MPTTFGFDCSAATSESVRSATKPLIAFEKVVIAPEANDATATALAVLLDNVTI